MGAPFAETAYFREAVSVREVPGGTPGVPASPAGTYVHLERDAFLYDFPDPENGKGRRTVAF